MATVRGLTAERMEAIEAASVVSGEINESGHLILTTFGGDEIDAGSALPALPIASTTQDGIVELATAAETVALTDDTRAVTPAGLASTVGRITTLEDRTTDKVQYYTPPLETTPGTSYPTGISIFYVSAGSGWTPNSGLGSVVTVKQSQDRIFQTFVSNSGASPGVVGIWHRTYHSTGAWTNWAQVANSSDPSTMGFTGEIKMYAGAAAPTGWRICDGSTINRTGAGAALFALIGTTYGAGNGTTTFNLPNLKGRSAVGLDASQTEFNALGVSGGAKTHTLTEAQMPSHTHIQNAHSHGGANYWVSGGAGTLPSGSFYGANPSGTVPSVTPTNQSTGGGQPHNILSPYLTVNYIIKL